MMSSTSVTGPGVQTWTSIRVKSPRDFVSPSKGMVVIPPSKKLVSLLNYRLMTETHFTTNVP